MVSWYYSQDGQRYGPITTAHLKTLAQDGELLPTDHVWKAGMTDWVPASRVNSLFVGVNTNAPRTRRNTPPPRLHARRAGARRRHGMQEAETWLSALPLWAKVSIVGGIGLIILILKLSGTASSGSTSSQQRAVQSRLKDWDYSSGYTAPNTRNRILCPDCGGTGRAKPRMSRWTGSGWTSERPNPPNTPCPKCHGSGYIRDRLGISHP